jgi:hypothetical protein
MGKYRFDHQFEKRFIEICIASLSMNQAAILLKMNYKTVREHAKRLGCFKANQSGKGLAKPVKNGVIPIVDIFAGKHQTLQSHKLKLRLIKEGLKEPKCEQCNLHQWMGVPIPLELHHCDGNRFNNGLENLKLLCPNCHALTDNYRAKNIRNLSARMETYAAEPLKFGETSPMKIVGNPEPSPSEYGRKGVET